MKFLQSLLAAMAVSFTASARADYLFTWHYIFPQLQRYQASFELSDAEMQPGASFNSDLFRNSISVSSLDGVSYNAKDPDWSDAGGHFGPTFVFYVNTHDDSHTLSLSAVAVGPTDMPPDPSNIQGSITEYFPDGQFTTERGWWSYQQIPEPSTAAFFGVAGILWLLRRRRR